MTKDLQELAEATAKDFFFSDADENGDVLMPNVQLPNEMVRMVTASRAYQANAAVLKRYQDMMNVTVELLK